MQTSSFIKILSPFFVFPLSASVFAGSPDIQPGTVIYKLHSDLPAYQLKGLNALLNSQGLVSERTLQGSQVTIATFEHQGREKAIANILQRSGYVEFAEPDYAVPPALQPNDPYYGSQWHHAAVNTPQAWNTTTGSSTALVAVCDTGFEVTHPDLSANMRTDLAYNAQDGSAYIADANGHGTGTAGTLGAVGNNGLGVAGINWNVDIIPVRIAISDSNSSAYISTMATCIEYAADQGARVVNLSYGGIQYATIDSAAQYLRSKNGLLFMSAGNDGQEFADYPDYTSFVGVGATNSNDTRASYSNWGTFVDITAPGSSIRTTYPGNSYVYYSGTSFSSPLAAGVAALMVAANPAISADEIENGLFLTARDIGVSGEDNVYGHGLVDAQAAVNYARTLDNLSAPVASINASSTSVPYDSSVTLSASGSTDSDGEITAYHWSLGDGTTSDASSLTHRYAAAGAYQVNLTVTDNDGLSNSATTVIQVTTDLPTAIITELNAQYALGETIFFNGSASNDSDGSISSYSWEFGNGDTASGAAPEYSYSVGGSYTVTLTVTDNAGAQNSNSAEITIVDPYILNAPTNLQASADGMDVTLNWQDNSSNEAEFVIERGSKYRGKTTFADVGTVAANVTSFVDNVGETGDYLYQVRAANEVNTATSEPVKVTISSVSGNQPGSGTLSPPDNLTATVSGDSVVLDWSYDQESIDGFTIQRGDKVRGKVQYSELAVIMASDARSYTDIGLTAGTYSYRIQAFSAEGEVSDYSNSTEARVK